MNLQEIWQIKAELSKITKDMTTAELKEYYVNTIREFNKVIGNQSANLPIISIYKPLH